MRKSRILYLLAIMVSICGCSNILDSRADSARSSGLHSASGNPESAKWLNMMQRQEEELKLLFSDSRTVWIRREGTLINVRISADACFDRQTDLLKAGCSPVIEKIAGVLNDYPKTAVRIEGHTENLGAAQKQRSVSRKQAERVMAGLIEKNVDRSRLTIYAYGGNQPVASNRTGQGRAKNRRIEIMIEPSAD